MAQRTIVELTDDIDGGKADETVSFALEGKNYEIDLTDKNASKLRGTFSEYVSTARRRGGASAAAGSSRGRRGGGTRANSETGTMREWAMANGHKVSARGRISRAVAAAYAAAHG